MNLFILRPNTQFRPYRKRQRASDLFYFRFNKGKRHQLKYFNKYFKNITKIANKITYIYYKISLIPITLQILKSSSIK